MGAVGLREFNPARTVAQKPLGDAAKGIPLYNSVGPSWTASRRPCTECLPGDADHLADLQVFRLGLREMGAVGLCELHPARTVAQEPLGDAAEGFPLYNGVGSSWAASRRPCNECLPGDADHLADLQVFRLGLREMGAVGLCELYPARTVAQEPLGDAAERIPLYNGVGPSWAAPRRPCTECLS